MTVSPQIKEKGLSMQEKNKRYPEEDKRLRKNMYKQLDLPTFKGPKQSLPIIQLSGSIAYLCQKSMQAFQKGDYIQGLKFLLLASLASSAAAQTVINNSSSVNDPAPKANLSITRVTTPDVVVSNNGTVAQHPVGTHSSPTFFVANNSTNQSVINSHSDTHEKPASKESSKVTKKYDQKLLEDLVAKMPILLQCKAFEKGFSEQSESFVKMKQLIRKLIPYAIKNEILIKILKSPGFNIEIRLPNAITGERYNGGYSYQENTIIIPLDDYNPATHGNLLNILSNELNHAAVCIKRQAQVGTTPECTNFPNAAVIKEAYEEGLKNLNEAIEDFLNYQKAGGTLPPSSKVQHFLNTLEGYQPMLTQHSIDVKLHETIINHPAVQTLPDGRIFIPKGFIILGEDIEAAKDMDLYVEQVTKYDNTVRYTISCNKDTSLISTANTFILYKRLMNTKHKSGYSDLVRKHGDSMRISELVSDVEMYPPKMQRLYFRKLCRFLSKFHEVDNYCSRSLLPSP